MQPAHRPEQLDIGAILAAPAKDPDWLVKCLTMGAMMLIPILGGLNMSGWTKAIADRRAEGDTLLPPANLSYIGAGWRLFVAWLPLLTLVFGSTLVVATGTGVAVWSTARNGGGSSELIEGLVFTAIMLVYGGLMLFSAVLTVVSPAINFLHIVDGDRFSSVSFKRQWELMKEGGTQYLLLFVTILVAGLVAQLGILAFFIGILVTAPYAQAMQGVALAEYARILRPKTAGFKVEGTVGGASGSPFGVTL